ncbi:amidase [Aliishimia ponticola]|uniref:Amidase n=1 Tax=Aliishimia ponticola TaxID=2499833 RepID=A0A4S4N7P1_9RHOB|nr:amidase [Aliishimia ponticola]THH35099.1 amidase [Aliishimia ponticola]
MSDIWKWTATETAARVASGDVTALEVAEATLARIAEVEPALNALSEVTEAIALEAADAVDTAYANGEALGPLAGVPITTKNNVDQSGTLNTGGMAAAKDNRCAQDSPMVANLKRAGAVVVGRTNVPAFSFRWFTDTDLHGRTYNPHGRTLSPGGSSGGAGVAVATGMGPIAHGNDIGGSIRFPAYANGVVGLRATVGRVPTGNPSGDGRRAISSQLITADGPLARSVADLRLGLNAMSGPDPRDPQHVPMPAVGHGAVPAHIGLVRGSGLGTPAAETVDALERAAHALEAAGSSVEEITMPRFEDAFDIWLKLVLHATYHHYGEAIRTCGDRALIHKIEMARQILPEISGGEALDLWTERLQIMRDWSLVFDRFPVVLMPVSYRHGLEIDADQGDAASLEQLFHDQSPLLATALLGHPGLSVPTGLAADGKPTGVQLAARWWDEATLLAAGQVIEDAMPAVHPIDPRQ